MTLPSALLDLRAWKLTLPIGEKGHPTEIKQPDLATYTSAYFQATPAADGTLFRAPVNGVTTSGSKNCRSELREMKGDGKTLAAWSSTDGLGHAMFQDMAFTRLPTGNDGVGVVGGQIHDADDDIAVWRCEASGLWLALGDHREDWKLIDPGYRVGTRISTAFVVSEGEVIAYYQGREVHRFDAVISGCYFKAGAYTQAGAGVKPNDSTNYGECVYYDLDVVHGPVPTPVPVPPPVTPPPTPVPDPPPAPVPTPVPVPSSATKIVLIRHAEKPSDKNSHDLSPTGYRRAQALVGLFLKVPIKAGLAKPESIFASKGKTASNRPVETAQPTAAALGLQTDSHWDAAHGTDAGKTIAKMVGSTLIVWAHTEIPLVVKGIASTGKVSPTPPKAWSSSRFDLAWVFDKQPNGTWAFSQVTEGVLPGDKDYGISKVAGFVAAVKQAVGIGR